MLRSKIFGIQAVKAVNFLLIFGPEKNIYRFFCLLFCPLPNFVHVINNTIFFMKAKNLILMALLCLVGWSNAWADTATLNQSSNKDFTTDPTTSTVTFSITNLGDWANAKTSWTGQHCAGYEVSNNTKSEISWSVSSGYTLTVNSVTVGGKVAGDKAFDLYSSTNSNKKSDTVKGNNADVHELILNKDEGYFSDNSNTEVIYIEHGNAILYINYITINYTLANLQSGEITIHENTINAGWNIEYDVFGATNIVDYNTGADQSEISIISNNEAVAHYDASTKKIITGTTTGTAIFTVSGNATATHSKPTDQTFTVNVDAIAYNYALQFLNANGDASPANTLADTHNKSDVDAILTAFRANKIASVANGDDVTYMIDNPDFQYSADWDYGWTGTNDENHSGDGSAAGNEKGDPMNGYQKYVDGENVYPRMYRGNWGLYNYTLKAGNVYQDIQLVAGYYRLGADAKCNSNNDNINLTGTLYAKVGENIIGKYDKNCVKNSGFANIKAGFAIGAETTVTIGYSHNELGGSAQKEVAVDNFTLTYICSKEIYDAYMEQYNRAETLKDDARLQAATKEAITAAAFVDINTLADAAAIEAQTTTLKEACDAAEADIAWVENNAATVNINNVYVYADSNKKLSRGANYGTRAIIAENGLLVNITTTNGIANLTFIDTNKKLFETEDHCIYTDYNNSGSYDFYLLGDEEDGYKIVLAGDRTKALGIVENMEWETGKFADVVMPVDVAEATVWHFAEDKSKLSVKANRYGTFCAPYNVTLPDNVIAYSAAIDGTAVILTELQDKNVVPANTPVIIKNDNNEDVTAYYYGEAATAATVTAGPLVGVFVDMPVPVGAYVMQIQNDIQNFYIVVEGKQPNITKNKAYIQTDSQARQLTLVTNEETAIDVIEALLNNKTEIYDLNGRRMNSLQKGINIVNGKKIIVK